MFFDLVIPLVQGKILNNSKNIKQVKYPIIAEWLSKPQFMISVQCYTTIAMIIKIMQ